MPSSIFRSSLPLLAWAVLYYAAGYVSLLLDNPASRVAAVWFAAGVSVPAFLIMRRRLWPALFCLFLLASLLLGIQLGHDFGSSLVVSAISLLSDLATAWLVRRYQRPADELHGIALWVGATAVASAVSAVLGVAWLALTMDVPFADLIWVWWAANVTGVLFGTVVLLSLMRPGDAGSRPSPGQLALGLAAWMGLCASAWYLFEAGRLPGGTSLHFALACLPVGLAVVVTLACGNRAGALALLSLAIIVMHYSAGGSGPFFARGMRADESLLLAQCYLVAAALLQAFLRGLIRLAGRREGAAAVPGLMYRLDAATGRLWWDGTPQKALGLRSGALDTMQAALEQAHPDDRAALQAHWAASGQAMPSFAFRLAARDGGWVAILDEHATVIPDTAGAVVVGSWRRAAGRAWR